MTYTCMECLQGQHRRCSGRHECACSICASRPRTVAPKVPSGPAKAKKVYQVVKKPAKVTSGAPKPTRDVKIKPEDLEWAVAQKNEGRTFRAIAEDLDVNYSYLARRIKNG